MLESPSTITRNAVALALRGIAADETVEPLIQCIQQYPETCGTIVYALETHDCHNHFLFLFTLALGGHFEAQNHALDILFHQQFPYDQPSIDIARERITEYKRTDHSANHDLIADLEYLLADTCL